VIVVISESNDIGSKATLGTILRDAQLANITIYCVGLSSLHSQLKDFRLNNGTVDLIALTKFTVEHVKAKIGAHALELAAAATGGDRVATYGNRSVMEAIDEIGGELHSQYLLSYTPNGVGDEGWHEISVTLPGHNGLAIRARPGYFIAPNANE
jgi:VWFA-related protein